MESVEASPDPKPGLNQVPSEGYQRLYDELDADVKRAVEKKRAILLSQPLYRSLNLTRLCPLHWRIWVNVKFRPVFMCDETSLTLLYVGSHDDYERWIKNNC